MRLAARKDRSHKRIVDGLRERGLTIVETYQLGNGAPDFFVFARKTGYWLAIEVKAHDTPIPQKQVDFHRKTCVYMTDELEAVLMLCGESSEAGRVPPQP